MDTRGQKIIMTQRRSDLPIVDLVRTSSSIMEHLAHITKVDSTVISSLHNRATCSMDTRGGLDPLKGVFLLSLDMAQMDKALQEAGCLRPTLLVNFVRTNATTSFSAI